MATYLCVANKTNTEQNKHLVFECGLAARVVGLHPWGVRGYSGGKAVLLAVAPADGKVI